jgi:RND family efflux transporter MFP subunit
MINNTLIENKKSKMKSKIKINKSIKMKVIHGISAVMILFLYACGGGGTGADKSQTATTQDSMVLVKVQTVAVQPEEQLTELTGNIEANKVNYIAPTIPGRIDDILVEVGSRVSKGQLLVQMDRTNLVQAQLQLANAERELGRVSELHKSGSATQQQYDQLTSQVDVLRETIRNLAENTDLHSPIDGVVTMRSFDAKNIFGGAQPILIVMQMAPVKVMVSISEIYFPMVKTGMEVRVRLDVYPDRNFTGRVNIIYPTIDQLSRTFKAEVTIANADMALRPGMFARVELNFGTLDHVVVPDVSIIKQPGTNTRYVYTIENGLAFRRELQLGRLMGSNYEVISGIEQGAQVVIAGQSRLLHQTSVKIDN